MFMIKKSYTTWHIENHIPIYDSLFLALSLKEEMILVTRDKKQKEVAEKLKIRVILEE